MNGAQRAVQRVAATSPGSAFFRSTRIDAQDRFVHRLTGGRATVTGVFAAFPTVFVTTTGALTGRPHTVPLVAVTDGAKPGRVGLIASNYGRPHDPDWCHNLRARPEAVLHDDEEQARYLAEEVFGEAYERWFALGDQLYMGYKVYRRRAGRHLPVFELTPV